MRPLRFLVLTDHGAHSDQNSLYALVRKLVADPRCASVEVASRSNPLNQAFFSGDGAQVHGLPANANFTFDSARDPLATTHVALDPPAAFDVVWLRLPHPVSETFFASLEAHSPSAPPLLVNNPQGIRETSTKAYLTAFPEWTPPTRLVATAEEARDFAARHPIVLKPLRAYGGQGILRLDTPDDAVGVDFSEPYLAMKFLRNVSAGDKRILVVNGQILAASLRIPPPGEWLCNVARGGTSVGAEVDDDERALIAAISPELLARGICFAGIDTLLNDEGRRVLSEINTLSIGGFPQAEAQTGRPVVQEAIDQLFAYCYDRI